ncbi:MAG: polyprenyl diphosphate synthase [Planctomycetota bacterium]
MSGALPRHIAFIMDGNGRWAKERGLERISGHREGARTLREITRYCRAQGVREVTFFALSTENYRARPKLEIRYLMTLLKDYLVGERSEIAEQNIRLCSIGRIEELPASVIRELRLSEELSCKNDGMVLRLALNYGSRSEILDAIGRIAAEIVNDQRPARDFLKLAEGDFARYLYDPAMSDPDLLIRTAGEMRVSNFLLWQISYAELWVTQEKWPDFTVEHLKAALRSYNSRDRRFGRVTAGAASADSPTDGDELP